MENQNKSRLPEDYRDWIKQGDRLERERRFQERLKALEEDFARFKSWIHGPDAFDGSRESLREFGELKALEERFRDLEAELELQDLIKAAIQAEEIFTLEELEHFADERKRTTLRRL